MTRRYWLAAAACAVALPFCVAATSACSMATSCVMGSSPPSAATGLMFVIVFTIALLAWILRTGWLGIETVGVTRHLTRCGLPDPLRIAMGRTGVRRVVCIRGQTATAFCAGAINATIYVSHGMAFHLRPEELEAVLLHEECHRRRCDPLRQAAREACADVCFFLPLVAWWADRQREKAELRADRAALQRVGAWPLAGALWTVDAANQSLRASTFAGALHLRVAQVLGDPLPRYRPGFSLWVRSVGGLVIALTTTWCVTQLPFQLSMA